jgi:hypothetical protein
MFLINIYTIHILILNCIYTTRILKNITYAWDSSGVQQYKVDTKEFTLFLFIIISLFFENLKTVQTIMNLLDKKNIG